MTGVEFFPDGLEGLIVIKHKEYSLSWYNITSELDFIYTLSSSQEAYQQEKNNTYYQHLSEVAKPGSYIYNEPYESDHRVDSLIWHSTNKTFVLNSELEAEMPLNITVSAPSVVISNVTTININKVNIVTRDMEEDKPSGEIIYKGNNQGPVLINNLGSEKHPVYAMDVKATHFILSGDSWVYKLNVETSDREEESALVISNNICTIDTKVMKTFAGYDITLKTNGDEQCIAFGGKFLAEHSLKVSSHYMSQVGLIASNGNAEINVNKAIIEGEIIVGKNLIFEGTGNLFFNATSVLQSNINITATGYKLIAFDGKVEASEAINLSGESVKQTADSSITTKSFSFQGDEITLCGNINVEELNLQARAMEFCSTAQGKIGRVIVSGGEFAQNGNVTIGSFEAINTTVKGNIYVQNFTASLIGDAVLKDHIVVVDKMKFEATGIITNKANLRANTGKFIAASFNNERGGKLELDGMGTFILEQDINLNPGSKIQVGAINVIFKGYEKLKPVEVQCKETLNSICIKEKVVREDPNKIDWSVEIVRVAREAEAKYGSRNAFQKIKLIREPVLFLYNQGVCFANIQTQTGHDSNWVVRVLKSAGIQQDNSCEVPEVKECIEWKEEKGKQCEQELKGIQTLHCKGCQLIVRGTEPSSISVFNFKNEIEFYKKEPGTISCGSQNYPRWICGRERNSAADRFFGGGSYENVYCSGSSSCQQEQHSYGEKGVVSINGKLNLGAKHISLELSDTWVKELNLTTSTIAPTIDSKHINKVVSVSRGVIGMSGSPYTCANIAASYGIPGASCVGATSTGHTLTKAIDEVSASFRVGSITGEIEEGLLLNWKSMTGEKQLTEMSTALVPVENFKQMGDVYYMSPTKLYDMEKIFKGTSFINFNLKDSLFNMNSEFIQSSLVAGIPYGALQVIPLMMSRSFTCMCPDKGEEQDQLDCEQFIFLKQLGFEGIVPTQFDFGVWKEIMDTFIYQRTDFHLIEIISSYGSSVNMFRDFAANALMEYKKIKAIPGVPLSEYQKNDLVEPIVWPVWSEGCLTRDATGNMIFSGIKKCISYELYVPNDYVIEQVSGAVFAGKYIDIKITGDVIVGPGGQILQMDTEVIRAHIRYLGSGEGGISISREKRETTLNDDGKPASLIKVSGNVVNLGGIGGRLSMHIEGGSYASGAGRLNFIDQGEIIADSSIEVPLEQDGTIIAVPKTTLFCTAGKENCVLHHRTTVGDVERIAVQTFIDRGDLIIESAEDLNERTFHTKTQLKYYQGDTYISRPDWSTFRQQTFVGGGQMTLRAKGKYLSQGGAYFVEGGGVIHGDQGTTMQAITSIGEYYSITEKEKFLSSTTTEVRALSTHTTVVEIETGSSSNPIVIGSEEEESLTTVEGLISIGRKDGPGIVIQGGAGVKMLEHLIPEWMEVTVERSGLLSSSGPKADLNHVRGLKNIESLKYKDWLGFTTGMITDAVAGYKTYNAIQGASWAKDLQVAGGVAIAAAILGEIFHAGVSFGEEVTVISQEGTTSIPNVIGKACTKDECSREGFFGIYSSGDVTIEHTKVNVKKIDGLILGHLNLKKGTDTQSTKVEQEKNTINFDISLNGVSVGVSHMDGESKQDVSIHHATEFHAEEVTLVINKKLELEGAMIDGEAIDIEAEEITVKDVINRVKSRSNFVQVGVGVMFSFWGGGFSPQVSASTGDGVKDSDLVQFVSGITGQDVEVTAKKITASLEAITGKVNVDEFVEIQRPTSSKSESAWSVGGSFSVGKDGVPNPGLTFSHQEDDKRISSIISADLFEGLKEIGKWLDEKFGDMEETTRSVEKILPKEEKIKKKQTKEEESKERGGKPPFKEKETKQSDDQAQAIQNKREKTVEKVSKVVESRLDKILAKEDLTPKQKAQVREVILKDMQALKSGDTATRLKTYDKYRHFTTYAQEELNAGVLRKISVVFNSLFGSREAHANPAVLVIGGGAILKGLSAKTIFDIGALVIGTGTLLKLGTLIGAEELKKLGTLVARGPVGTLVGLGADATHTLLTSSDGEDDSDSQEKLNENMKKLGEALVGIIERISYLEAEIKILEEEQKIIEKFEEETEIEIATGNTKDKTFHSEIHTEAKETRAKPQVKVGDHVEATTGDPSQLDEFYKSSGTVLDKPKQKVKIKDQSGMTSSPFGLEPDDDPNGDEDGRKINPEKSESKAWKELKPYRGKIRTNGLKGSKRQYYEWDHTHNDIEVFDHNGNHLGSMNPKNGNMYKGPKGHVPSFK